MKNNGTKIPWWEPGMVLFARLSVWIGGPIIVAVFLGKWLDKKYNSAPWLFLATVGIAFIVSSVGIVKEAKQMMDKIVKEERLKKEKVNPSTNSEKRLK